MNFRKNLGNIFVTPHLLIKNFMIPILRSYNVEETCNPQCALRRKYAFWGLFHWTKFSLKFVAIQKSLDFFVTPLFLMKKNSMTPSFFMAPYSEENDSPLGW